MELIGRGKEKAILQNALKLKTSSFVAVYGRRRVGKTFLIRQSFSNSFSFQCTGIFQGKLKEQLENFSSSLSLAGLSGNRKPENWVEAFHLLKETLLANPSKKKVIFLDELSWLDVKGSGFVGALEAFWNGWASGRSDIVLVVCASATSWMIDQIIHGKGGLYHRLTDTIHLLPFTLRECEEFAKAASLPLDRYAIAEAYMVLGGIPYYWSLLKPELSFSQNIDYLFGGEHPRLEDEFIYLYSSIFSKPESYIALVTALGKKKSGLERDELLKAAKQADNGTSSKRLRELEDSGFIRRYVGYHKKERSSLYQLIDNFTFFYFEFLQKRPNDPHFFTHSLESPEQRAWAGFAFERLCLEHLPQIKRALGISDVLTEAYSWSCKADLDKGIFGSQIDLLIERKDRVINLCEMKFSINEFVIDKDYDEKLRQKISDFVRLSHTRYSLRPTLVTTYGLKENAYAGRIASLVTLKDLFA